MCKWILRRIFNEGNFVERAAQGEFTVIVDGALDREGYELTRDAARLELEATERELARLGQPRSRTKSLPGLEGVLKRASQWLADLHSGDTVRQRALLALLVESVTVEHLGRSRYHPYVAHVVWTSLGTVCASLGETPASDPIEPMAQTIEPIGSDDEGV